VGTFNAQRAAGATAPSGPPAQLVTGSKANSQPRTLPAQTGSASNSVDSGSTRSSMTKSIVSRLSQMEGTLAKVDRLDQLMNLIAGKMGILTDDAPSPLVPPTPNNAPPTSVNIVSASNAPVSQLDQVAQSTPATEASPSRPDGGRPLTYEGPSSSQATLHEIRQSPSDTVQADVSKTDVGRAG
jgi:hypothetical protein